jgi:hypothetical protein
MCYVSATTRRVNEKVVRVVGTIANCHSRAAAGRSAARVSRQQMPKNYVGIPCTHFSLLELAAWLQAGEGRAMCYCYCYCSGQQSGFKKWLSALLLLPAARCPCRNTPHTIHNTQYAIRNTSTTRRTTTIQHWGRMGINPQDPGRKAAGRAKGKAALRCTPDAALLMPATSDPPGDARRTHAIPGCRRNHAMRTG